MNEMFKKALKIIGTLRTSGNDAFFAGGYVRDFLMGIQSNDIDIATNALPEQVEALFEKTLSVGKSFGVIIVIIEETQFEVATFRNDGYSSDGRHPDVVTFSSIEEDAKRRDFTINGMFYDPIENKIIDFVNGKEDIKNRIVRFIGIPNDRIFEDKLRMLRALRFSARFEFEIELESFSAIVSHAELIKQMSPERIGEELVKILSVKNRSLAIDLLFSSGLMKHILPEVYKMDGCEQPPEFHSEGDVKVHTSIALQSLPEDASPELLLATLLHDVGKPVTQTFEDRIRFNGHEFEGAKIAEVILKRFKFSNEVVDHVCSMIRNHMKFISVRDMRTSRLKRFMNLPKFEEHLMLHKADCSSCHKKMENYNFVIEKQKFFESTQSTVKISSLPKIITGFDLIEMGYKQGPLFRTILEDIIDHQLEESINDKETAISYIKTQYPLIT